MNNASMSYMDVKERYDRLRELVYARVNDAFKQYHVVCRRISRADVQEADSWRFQWKDKQKIPSWEWTPVYDYYSKGKRNTFLKRFDLALEVQGVLLALCYGLPSKKKVILKVHALARKPGESPLAGGVMHIVLYAAATYANLLGSHEIWLVDPMNEKLASKYEALGYEPQYNARGKVTHLVLRLKNG